MDLIGKKGSEPSGSSGDSASMPAGAAPGRIGTTLGEDTEFNGTLKFGKSLKIEGKFQGDLASPGLLIIGRSGQVRAEIKVGSLTVEGKLTGNIRAKDLVDLRSTAEVYGDITASKIKIEEGVILRGKTEIKPADSKSQPLSDLAGKIPATQEPEPKPVGMGKPAPGNK